jgi:hypothetical protein
MRVLVACEYSNIVASAFRLRGHSVLSCDIIENDFPSRWHIKDDVFNVLKSTSFDLMIAFPPCTYLCNAQFHLLAQSPERQKKSLDSVDFVRRLYLSQVPKIAIENPIGVLNSVFRKPDQITSPANFGNQHHKDICLWLKNLPPLIDTCINVRRQPVRNHVNGHMSQEQKSKIKSKFFPELAAAMANQWG